MQALDERFQGKYSALKLYEIVYDKSLLVCSITFLYPYNMEDLKSDDRVAITNFLKEFLGLKARIQVKLRKSYLDEGLIKKEVVNFFNTSQKSVAPYITENNIKVCGNGFDQKVDLHLNQDVLSMLDERDLSKRLKEYLNQKFIANFDIYLCENGEVLPSEIDYVDIPIYEGKTRRFKVNIDKKLVGGDIAPQPEYLADNDKPKEAVILAGIITKIEKRTFKIKKGAKAGQDKALYTFNLTDEDAQIECVHFCAKSNEKALDKLEDGMYLLCLGSLRKGLSGNLTYYVTKLSLASNPVKTPPEEIIVSIPTDHKHVVFPEPLYSPSQSNLFADKPKYNNFILTNTIVVFDIETTGLDPESCEITELGAVKIVGGEVKEKFQTFVRPKSHIPEEVSRLTGITDEMVANAPSIESVIADFYDYTRGCVISGYNVVGFDMKFIQKAGKNCGLNFDNNVVDALILARTSRLRVVNYKLGTVVKALGLTLNDAHRAYNDAYATGLVLLELNKTKAV